MQDVEAHADRARKNRLLATALFGVSFAVLATMLAVVFLVRSGVLAHLIAHLGQLY